MKNLQYIATLLACIVVICAIRFPTSHERFEDLQDGSCKCCKCGWTSCELCAKNRAICCGNSMSYERYSFKPDEAQLIDPMYTYVPHVRYKQDSTPKK